MPRKAPKEVVEHRITLGDFERKQLVEAIDSYQRDKVLENVPNIMLGTAGLVVAGTAACVGYAVYYWLDSVPSITGSIKNIFTSGPDAVRAAMKGYSSNSYGRYKTIDEVNAAWDKVVEDKQQDINNSARFIASYEAGQMGIFAPEWMVKFQRAIIANEAETMAKLAEERSEYIENWTAYWTERNAE